MDGADTLKHQIMLMQSEFRPFITNVYVLMEMPLQKNALFYTYATNYRQFDIDGNHLQMIESSTNRAFYGLSKCFGFLLSKHLIRCSDRLFFLKNQMCANHLLK